MTLAEPIYERIEFCRKPETLWGKIATGRWDWLGVHPDGQFVLGAPARHRGFGVRASGEVQRAGAPRGEHGVRVSAPNAPQAGTTWCATEDEAKAAYRERLDQSLARNEKPRLERIARIERGRIVEEEFVVHRPPTFR